MLGSLLTSRNSLINFQDEFGQRNFLGFPFQILGGDKIKLNNNNYDLTPEIYEALSSTSCTGKTMKNENDILMMGNIINDSSYTDNGDKSSERK